MRKPASATTPGNLYLRVWRWHLLSALIAIPFVLWQSVTGVIYLWSPQWMAYAHHELLHVIPRVERLPLSQQIASAARAAYHEPALAAVTSENLSHGAHGRRAVTAPAPEAQLQIQEILLPGADDRSTIVLFQTPRGLAQPFFVDPYSGKVLGSLSGYAWLPGFSRALHGGWPLGQAGSYLLEIADGWTVVMICTGLYLWWPRGRSVQAALIPRRGLGLRVFIRDLHASVAVTFSVLILFFLLSALPWTAFWGGQLLSRLQAVTGQQNPAGFAFGGATVSEFSARAVAVDQAVEKARQLGLEAALSLRMDPGERVDIFLARHARASGGSRYLRVDPENSQVTVDVRESELPGIARMVETGVHVHQGDFGLINIALNTMLALALMWLAASGAVSWWMRRPPGASGVPAPVPIRGVNAFFKLILLLALAMPLFGLSLLVTLMVASAGSRVAGTLRT